MGNGSVGMRSSMRVRRSSMASDERMGRCE